MCGRTCCTLCPEAVPLACSVALAPSKGSSDPPPPPPTWCDPSDGAKFEPTTNLAPTKHIPILCRGDQVDFPKSDFVVQPMLWGFVPPWFQGPDPKKTGFSNFNARVEGLKRGGSAPVSKMYHPAIDKNSRCVVVVDGFYEWKTLKDGQKQPYLVFAPQPKGLKIQDMAKFDASAYDDKKGWQGPRPLFLAGLYSVWRPAGDKESPPVYSFTVITCPSSKAFKWLHDRAPGVLPDAESVQKWLDPAVVGEEALEILQPLKEGEIEWHPVSKTVGNVANKGEDLSAPVTINPQTGLQSDKSANLMKSWLIKRKTDNQDKGTERGKKIKVEDEESEKTKVKVEEGEETKVKMEEGEKTKVKVEESEKTEVKGGKDKKTRS